MGIEHSSRRQAYNYPLHEAVVRDDVTAARKLLAKGFNINHVESQTTPLNIAVQRRSRKMFEFLLKEGADVNLTEDVGIPVLHQVVRNRQFDFLQLLMASGSCYINTLHDGESALHVAFSRWSDIPIQPSRAASIDDIMDFLVSCNIDINLRDKEGMTVLHICAERNNTRFLRVLLRQKYIKVNVCNKEGKTPLMLAIANGNQDIIRTLLKNDCDVNIQDMKGRTALCYALKQEDLSVVRLLVEEHNCKINVTDSCGSTPLMYACNIGNYCLVAYLISMGSHMNWRDNRGHTALSCSVNRGFIYSVETLLKKGATACIDVQELEQGRTPLYVAASKGYGQLVQTLITKGADLHIPTKDGKSPLYVASYFGHLEIVKMLIEAGADVNQTDSHGKTPLYVATYHDHPNVVSLLLSAGAKVNLTDRNGKSALYVAVNHGNLIVAEKLIKGGVNINSADIEGLCPLALAVKFPKLDIPMVKLLVTSGCDPMNLDKFIDWLVESGIIPREILTEDEQFYQLWTQLKRNPRPLKQHCREQIQGLMGSVHQGLPRKLAELPLPSLLQDYLKVKPL